MSGQHSLRSMLKHIDIIAYPIESLDELDLREAKLAESANSRCAVASESTCVGTTVQST